ncbi:hypothetical protein FGO68_gene16038 [Halteria grandinella]|uniref:Uncharacterized protein n=1 Tax=Halteria grandinella TaxID=5974 RepID=A0A8J8NSX8_HALGN|nr:hypothetical protein FGO68_gene16038 [Halteria grandinella]
MLGFMNKLKHELLCLASEEPNFDTKQSDHFLDSAKSLIKQCSEVQIHFESLSQRIKSAMTQYQQKVQAIMGNFEQKLQVYLSCEDQSLALKDQESFINANQVVIEQIRQSVKECQSQILQFSNIISPKTNPKKEKVSKLLVCKQQIVYQQKNSGIVSMVFKDLQSVQFNQFTEPQIICSGSFLSVSQQDIDISLIFRLEYN